MFRRQLEEFELAERIGIDQISSLWAGPVDPKLLITAAVRATPPHPLRQPNRSPAPRGEVGEL
jgi:hypothetical protein